MKMLQRLLLLFALVLCLGGCGSDNTGSADDGDVSLVVWGADGDTALVEKQVAKFVEQYGSEANLDIKVVPKSAGTCKEDLFADVKGGPDVFTFPDDQLSVMVAAGVIDNVPEPDAVREKMLDFAVEAASVNNRLYAYPLTSDNGYFLFYNKSVLSDSDVQSMESLLAAAAAQGKTFTMDLSSGWYFYSFWGNSGLEVKLNSDGLTNTCNFNATDKEVNGVDVASGILSLLGSPAFVNTSDSEFLAGVKNGTVAAGVSGIWNAKEVETAWGSSYGATKLPTYNAGGKSVQMASFRGCKLIGVNYYSKHRKWAHRLAAWLTSEENQVERFKECGQGPADKAAASTPEIANSPAIKALAAQRQYSQVQQVGPRYWTGIEDFAHKLTSGAAGNLQGELDEMVAHITGTNRK